MTKTSIYCYERNGGGCRNKVSLTNNYICGAGHGGSRQGGLIPSETSVVAPAIDLSEMSIVQKRSLSWGRETPPETLAKLARDKDRGVRQAVAGNRSALPEALDKLAGDRSSNVRQAVAGNTSTPPETLAKMARDKDRGVRAAVAWNSSASRETHISLAQEDYVPYGFTRGKPIGELIKDIHLVDQYPGTFGMAYLHRLLERSLQEDASHPKRRALIGYVYAKYVESKADNSNTKWYKDKIKVLFPDDQEMAEMIGY